MNNEVAEFQQALTDLEVAFKQGIRAFAEWFEREWQHDDREHWE